MADDRAEEFPVHVVIRVAAQWSPATHIQQENRRPHTTTTTVHCYHLMKSLHWRVNK